MITQLLKILRESIKAVPAMKYALAVAGILAVVAMVGAFKLSPQTAVFGAVITLVLMVAMVIFARLTTTASRHFLLPAKIMMWAFLVVTLGTAFLLFTSAFFQWPRGLRDLIDPRPAPPVARTNTDEVRNLIAAAQQQRGARDYVGAWNTIGRTVTLAPDSKPARDEQLQIAMAWLRNLSVRRPETFTNAVRPLAECLHENAPTAKGSLAADIRAHLGWANFLRSREGTPDLKIAEEYEAAVVFDHDNPFAHAMGGHWLARQKRPISEVNDRFQRALKTGRERPYVQELRIAALDWLETPESAVELIRVADEMRQRKEPLSADLRSTIFGATYSRFRPQNEAAYLNVLPPAEHLETFRWIANGRDVNNSAYAACFFARLMEATGDFAGAASQYRTLLVHSITLEEYARAGLARCEQIVAKPNNGARRK